MGADALAARSARNTAPGATLIRWRSVVGAAVVAALFVSTSWQPASRAVGAQSGEVRALWVDAFHDGIKSPGQIQKLVADARRANVNTLLVEVRRRGDAYYLGGPESPASDQPAGYDALRTLLDAAHGGAPRLEVKAWI